MANIELATQNTPDEVIVKIQQMQKQNMLVTPVNYCPENAIKAAWLKLQEVCDKDGKPALQVCSKVSVAFALLKMVVLGLSPAKEQGYFIVRGNRLCFDVSYFGNMLNAKRANPNIRDFYPEVVYEGDELVFHKAHGATIIDSHTQSLASMKKDKIIAAYCTVVYKDGSEESLIMPYDRVLESWKHSAVHPVLVDGGLKKGTVHEAHPDEMAKRTVVNAMCKKIIRSADDSYLSSAYAQWEAEEAEAQAKEEIEQNEATMYVDLGPMTEEDAETVTVDAEDTAPAVTGDDLP